MNIIANAFRLGGAVELFCEEKPNHLVGKGII